MRVVGSCDRRTTEAVEDGEPLPRLGDRCGAGLVGRLVLPGDWGRPGFWLRREERVCRR